ncbi:hypothetical protein K9L67_03555 [Candidatus Woesearchaeota archaeon]|nr:hypothetical protein [Candidatus Woesearchaeota archaeon]MCF7901277.1 hypothetical protein [Candidatus Woesearchaeota archaeon]MCF8013556.1 hypothetical protein [Candidatus Woesearchaeota archaeon]
MQDYNIYIYNYFLEKKQIQKDFETQQNQVFKYLKKEQNNIIKKIKNTKKTTKENNNLENLLIILDQIALISQTKIAIGGNIIKINKNLEFYIGPEKYKPEKYKSQHLKKYNKNTIINSKNIKLIELKVPKNSEIYECREIYKKISKIIETEHGIIGV